MTRSASVRRFALALTSLSLMAACGASGDSTSTAGATVPTAASTTSLEHAATALAGFVEFPRYLQLKRTVEVAITNSGDAPVRIRSVELDSSAFTGTAARAVDSTIGVGRRRDLQVPLGDPVCDDPESTTPGAVAHLVVTVTDGAEDVDLPIDPTPLLDIADDECGRAHVFESADIGFGDEWSIDDGVLTVPITMRVLRDDPVTLEQVAGSVIFVVEAAEPVAGSTDRVEVTIDAATPEAHTPIHIRAERCEPHAVAESKKTFVFPIWVRVADDEVRYVTIEPDTPLRDALQGLIEECQRALASVPR